jgi:hypothetical protein
MKPLRRKRAAAWAAAAALVSTAAKADRPTENGADDAGSVTVSPSRVAPDAASPDAGIQRDPNKHHRPSPRPMYGVPAMPKK